MPLALSLPFLPGWAPIITKRGRMFWKQEVGGLTLSGLEVLPPTRVTTGAGRRPVLTQAPPVLTPRWGRGPSRSGLPGWSGGPFSSWDLSFLGCRKGTINPLFFFFFFLNIGLRAPGRLSC